MLFRPPIFIFSLVGHAIYNQVRIVFSYLQTSEVLQIHGWRHSIERLLTKNKPHTTSVIRGILYDRR